MELTEEEREQTVECEIQACGADKVSKLLRYPLPWTPDQMDFIRLLCEQSFIEGRDSGISRSKEILDETINKLSGG